MAQVETTEDWQGPPSGDWVGTEVDSAATNDLSDGGQVNQEITLDLLAHKIDSIGKQMDWLCENLGQLFAFVSQMGQSGGGIRGLMKLMQSGGPDFSQQDGA